jgi:hypothetical protein
LAAISHLQHSRGVSSNGVQEALVEMSQLPVSPCQIGEVLLTELQDACLCLARKCVEERGIVVPCMPETPPVMRSGRRTRGNKTSI